MANYLLCTVRNIRQWKKLVIHTIPRKNLLRIQCNIVPLFTIKCEQQNRYNGKPDINTIEGPDYFLSFSLRKVS